jgi:putative transposase
MSKIVSNKNLEFDEVVQGLLSGKKLTGDGGLLTPFIKQVVEAALEAELDSHLSTEVKKNRKNGKSKKKMKTSNGSFELEVPRDRNSSFEPQIVKKGQTSFSSEIEDKILSLYSVGMSYRDMVSHIKEMYQIDISEGTISAITDKIIPKVKEWQSKPLERVYPFVWLDAIHYKIKENSKYISKAVYTIIGVDLNGKKDILGLYISESEGASFWLEVLTDLNNRGVKDILIASVDGLKGFPEAINTVFPHTEVQLCIVHQIRNSMKYVASKDHKEFAKDLKSIYAARTLQEAEDNLLLLDDKWGSKYPIALKSWHNNWNNLSHYFKYAPEIRKIIYTTNIVESVHRQFRKLTKTKGAFPNENSLLKLLFIGITNASKKWTMPIQNWALTLGQLNIIFENRLEGELKL